MRSMMKNNFTSKVISIIPVRGGSKGIPRKNARLLKGKPLMAYAIETCLKCSEIDKVVVSTEDEELREIAYRFGAEVIRRPCSLADDLVGLNEVVYHAVEEYEKIKGQNFNYVVTVQATSPTLSPASISKSIKKCRDEDLDTVLSVAEDTYLAWTINNKGLPQLLHKRRMNRQLLQPRYRETGGVVVCKREVLKQRTRFGEKIGLIELDGAEALDIDSRFDWWLAERVLERKRIVFRVEGYREIGLGHIYRVITLADRMIDHDIFFVVSTRSQMGIHKLKSHFYPVIEFDGKNLSEIKAIESCKPDIIINDILNTSLSYIQNLKQRGYTVINFEDRGDGTLEADLVINAMYDLIPREKNNRILVGPEYVCLRDEFYSIPPPEVKAAVTNILLLFGGTDPQDLSQRTLKWLDKIEGDWKITVIVGLGYRNISGLEKLAKTVKKEVQLIFDTSVVSKYISEADIGITYAGRSVFELAVMGIPSVVMACNERETHHVFATNEPGLVNLGLASKVKFSEFKRTLEELLNSELLRKKMSRSLLKNDLKSGVDRVWKLILEV